MTAAMDRNPQITVNVRDENIEALLQQIDTTNLDIAMAHLQAKYDTLATIPAFNSTDAHTGYGITSVNDKGITIDGSARSLEAFVLGQITLVREEKPVNPAEAIQKADQFIRSMALTQRVRDIERETNLDKVLEHILKERETLKKYIDDAAAKLTNLTQLQTDTAKTVFEQMTQLDETIVTLYNAITTTQKEIKEQSRTSSNLFAITPGTKPKDIKANQARGADMVEGIKNLIDGPNGLREKCMEALRFILSEFPEAVDTINTNLAPLFPKDADEDEEEAVTLTATVFDTKGMNPDLLASLTPAQRVAKLAELTARHSEIMSAIEGFDSELQKLIQELEATEADLSSTRAEEAQVDTHIRLAKTQASVQASPAKQKSKFKVEFNEVELLARKTTLETKEASLSGQYTTLEKKINDLLGIKSRAEADLDAVLEQITELNSAFDDALAAYKAAQQDYSTIAADLNAEDARVKAILEESEAQKGELAGNLERDKAAATANRDAAKATFIKGQAENIDARLKEMFDLLKSNMEEGSKQFADDPAQHHDVMRKIVEETNPRILQEAMQLSTQRAHDRIEAFDKIEAEYDAYIKELDEKNKAANQALDLKIARLHETEETILANLEANKTPVDEAYKALKEIAAIAGKDIGDIVYIVDLADVAAHPAPAAADGSEDSANTEEEEEASSEDEDATAHAVNEPVDKDEEEALTPDTATPLTPDQLLAASEAGKLVAALEATLNDTFGLHDGAAAAGHQEEAHFVDSAGNSNPLGDDF